MHFRSLSTNLVTRAQAAVSHHSGWSYVSGPGFPPLLGLTVGQVVDRAAEMYGEREGLVVTHQNIRRTFTQIRDEAEALAAGFLELGMEPGDRVGIWGPNTHQWYVTQFAAAKAGLVLVNINPAYQAGSCATVSTRWGSGAWWRRTASSPRTITRCWRRLCRSSRPAPRAAWTARRCPA